MKNPTNPGGAPIGPRGDWGAWRTRRDKAIVKPRRKKTVNDLAKPTDPTSLEVTSEKT